MYFPLQVSFDQCTIRTAEEHHKNCALIEMAPDAAFHSTTYGINFNSPLNGLQYFHVTNFGLPPDPMHDLLEGYTNRITKSDTQIPPRAIVCECVKTAFI